jgi:diguanylate cyclase
LSINISVRQFLGPDFTDRLLERTRRFESGPVSVVIEITESLFMEDLDRITNELNPLREAGIQVALDDFGTGYSSLSLLRHLPVDELKIDRSFVVGVDHDEYARKLVQSIIGIGKTHGIKLIAEGVETEQQFESLKEYGCEGFQGYLFARPMALTELEKFLRAQKPGPDSP